MQNHLEGWRTMLGIWVKQTADEVYGKEPVMQWNFSHFQLEVQLMHSAQAVVDVAVLEVSVSRSER